VDLAGDLGLRPLGVQAAADTLQRFDGSGLASQIQAVLEQFKRGVKPASLGLGEDCPTDASARLLLSLYRPWGRGTAGRRFPRRHKQGSVELTGDWLTIGFAVDGEIFRQPKLESPLLLLRDDISLFTFGERAMAVTDSQQARERNLRDAERLGLDYEQWELIDHSVGGFRLRRGEAGERLAHHQLVGVRPLDGDRFVLGDLSWLMYREDGVLEAGVEVLPGVPHMVAVRQAGPKDGRKPYQQGFLLPESPSMKSPAALVLPVLWFQAGQLVEVRHRDQRRQVRLSRMLRRGANFDLCSYEAAEPSPA